MAKRETRYDDYLGIPVERDLKEEVAAIAESEERNMTEMARLLLKDGIAAHREAAKGSDKK